MNDPSKAINVNLSSLLSLKAELLRKQTEVNKAKAIQTPADEYVGKKYQYTSNNNNKNEEETNSNESKDEVLNEDLELLAKSQRILHFKSKFYDNMMRTGGRLNSDDNCLVLFNRKQQVADNSKDDFSDTESDGADERNSDGEEDWVEYTDCLGRTRKCLRKDLENAKEQDAKLAASMPERLDQNKANWSIDIKRSTNVLSNDDDDSSIIGPLPTESLCSEALTVISKQDEVRAKWESKELENSDKKGVHYQDVFFDEARQHGVGYYAFSTDESERQKQQHELEESRQRTIEEQTQRDALRLQRDKIIAERVLAAKNRQRARLGLPPLQLSDLEAEKSKKSETELKESKEEKKKRHKQEKLMRKLAKMEEEREFERQQHIRPWDAEKSGVSKNFISNTDKYENANLEEKWQYKPERLPMSQEQWNKKQRSERKTEFAPPPNLQIKPSEMEQSRRNFISMPPPIAYESQNGNFMNFQSTKFIRRSYVPEDNDTKTEKFISSSSVGTEIPPPTHYDENIKKPKLSMELESSIEAGLKFLRNGSQRNKELPKSNWTAKADYS